MSKIQLEVQVREQDDHTVTRHYVVSGNVRALCGILTLRRPAWLEHRRIMCQTCASHADALHRRESR